MDFKQKLREMTECEKCLHLKERHITLQSVDLVGELERSRAWFYLGMSVEIFAVHIGLTSSKYWKRAQVSRMFLRFPQGRELFEKGETQISHLAAVSGKITVARGKSKREVKAFISRVTCDGRILDEKPSFDISVRLDEAQFELLNRARDVLAHGGRVPSNSEILAQALDVLLDKKDPLRKAERAAERAEKAEKKQADAKGSSVPTPAGGQAGEETGERAADLIEDTLADTLGQEESIRWTEESFAPAEYPSEHVLGHEKPIRRAAEKRARVPIPAATRHAVWRRDEGRCTFVNPDGSRCGSEMMLELDHVTMVCRGGGNEVQNLRLRCRLHNQLQANLLLGYTIGICDNAILGESECGRAERELCSSQPSKLSKVDFRVKDFFERSLRPRHKCHCSIPLLFNNAYSLGFELLCYPSHTRHMGIQNNFTATQYEDIKSLLTKM